VAQRLPLEGPLSRGRAELASLQSERYPYLAGSTWRLFLLHFLVMSSEHARTRVRAALLALVVPSSLPFSSVEGWSILGVVIAAMGPVFCTFLVVAYDPGGLAPRARRMLILEPTAKAARDADESVRLQPLSDRLRPADHAHE
jgi:hypothetical protein